MPQPVRKRVELNLMVAEIAAKPVLASKIAQIVAISSLMESRLAAILASISGGSAEVTMAMFHAVNSTDAQRAMVRAAAETALQGHELETLLELLDDYRSRARERNKIVHGIWATSPAYPDGLLLARMTDLSSFTKRMAILRASLASAPDDLFGEISLNCMVYVERDFDDVLARLIGFDNQIAQFWVNLMRRQEEEEASTRPDELPLHDPDQDPPPLVG